MSENRKDIAMAMAANDGHEWEKLPEMYQNAYLHNADEDIKVRAAVPVDAKGGVVTVACKVCLDQAYVDGNPCPECNPVGLPAEDVHPGAAKVAVVDDSKKPDIDPRLVNLCDSCSREYPMCDSPNVEYGDGTGHDNIIKCEIYSPKQPTHLIVKPEDEETARAIIKANEDEAKRKARPLKPNEYRCSKCSKPGKTVIHMVQKSGKGVGTKHLEFKV